MIGEGAKNTPWDKLHFIKYKIAIFISQNSFGKHRLIPIECHQCDLQPGGEYCIGSSLEYLASDHTECGDGLIGPLDYQICVIRIECE